MKYSLSKFEKMGLIAMALIAGGFFYFTKIYDPEVKRFEEAQTKLDTAQKALSGMGNSPNSTSLEKAVKEQMEKVQSIHERIENLSRKSKNKADAQQVIAEIAQMAGERFLNVASQNFKGTQPSSIVSRASTTSNIAQKSNGDEFLWYQYELVLRGPYPGFTSLMKSMREADWIVALGDLRIRSSGEMGNVDIKMEILL